MTYKAKTFIDAIPGTGGNISRIARKVGCSWWTVKRAIERYPTVYRAHRDEWEKISDKAEDNIVQVINSGGKDPETGAKLDPDPARLSTSKWWLSRMRRDEYTERQEITGADGEPLVPLGSTLDERLSNLEDILTS